MSCCQCDGIDKVFSAKVAAKELKAYRKNGPHKATRMLIDALKTEGVEGMTLLDIGGGVGAIQHELLKDGVTTATNVDASSAYGEAAKQEADRLGLGDRVTYHFGDFVALAPQSRACRYRHARLSDLLLPRHGGPGGRVVPARP